MTGEPIVTVKNRHIDECGTPPSIDVDEWDYLSTFVDQHGEQHIFVYDYSAQSGLCYVGDAGWDRAMEISGQDILSLDLVPESKNVLKQLLGWTREDVAEIGRSTGFISDEEAEKMVQLPAPEVDEKSSDVWLRSCLMALKGNVEYMMEEQPTA